MGAQRDRYITESGGSYRHLNKNIPIKIIQQHHFYSKCLRTPSLGLLLEPESCSFEFIQQRKLSYFGNIPKSLQPSLVNKMSEQAGQYYF
jgi:hypothetical protein